MKYGLVANVMDQEREFLTHQSVKPKNSAFNKWNFLSLPVKRNPTILDNYQNAKSLRSGREEKKTYLPELQIGHLVHSFSTNDQPPIEASKNEIT